MICEHCGMLTKPFNDGTCEFCGKPVLATKQEDKGGE